MEKPPIPHDSEVDHLIINNWAYDYIYINDSLATDKPFGEEMELLEVNDPRIQNSFLRYDIEFRRIEFNSDNYYVINWEARGEYQLGFNNSLNYQPNFGSWQLNASEDSIIQNAGTDFETRYAIIELTDSTLVRRQIRSMSTTIQGANWSPGDWVPYEEHFKVVRD